MKWGDIEVKVVNYKLDLIGTVYNPDMNRAEFSYRKIENRDPCSVNLIFNKNIYTNKKVYDEIMEIVNSFLFEPNTTSKLRKISNRLNNFINACYINREIITDESTTHKGGMIVFKGEDNFKSYIL